MTEKLAEALRFIAGIAEAMQRGDLVARKGNGVDRLIKEYAQTLDARDAARTANASKPLRFASTIARRSRSVAAQNPLLVSDNISKKIEKFATARFG